MLGTYLQQKSAVSAKNLRNNFSWRRNHCHELKSLKTRKKQSTILLNCLYGVWNFKSYLFNEVMALNSNRELVNKKLLEELELNKKLLKQGVVPPLSSQNTLQSANQKNLTGPEAPVLSATQRSALNVARTQSYGYYIPQDSSFGNVILPVLPRFDDK